MRLRADQEGGQPTKSSRRLDECRASARLAASVAAVFEQLDTWMQAVGPLALLALGLAAMIEYIFPPFPGDTILLLGGVYAVRGEQSWVLVLAVVTAGSLVGAALNYWIGIQVAGRFERGTADRFLGIRRTELLRLQERMKARGKWLLVANRFMPGVRSLIFLAAGAARIPFATVMGLGAASALAWNVVILSAGIAVGGNLERLEAIFERYQTVALAIILAVIALVVVRAVIARRRRPATDAGE